MEREILNERGKSLEEQFFAKHNQKLLEQLKAKEAVREKKQRLATATGIADDAVLEDLIALDINSETLAALALVPLVEIAWADRRIEGEERRAVLEAAKEAGLGQETTGYKLLEGWLTERPPAALLAAWKKYVGALMETMGSAERAKLKENILTRASNVAQAAGSFLGDKTSEKERRMLEELDKAFQS